MDTPTRPRVVLAQEQALSMSYATLRLVHEGCRVIRIEATPLPGRKAKGDPNRSIGRPVAGADRHSYFVAPNVGKEAIAIDLKRPAGRALLHRLVCELRADVFCTNTLPCHHRELGTDHDTLAAIRPELVWCCISAMGPAHPDVPGYDPMLQALCGYMDLTGHADGPPLQCGPPLIDLRAGDEAFLQVMLALAERERSGKGRRIDISMAQVAVSWLHTFLPMLDMGSPPAELRRAGNEHRQFIPVNAYATRDGDVYIAIGSDAQWQRLVAQPWFAGLARADYATNEGRRAHKAEVYSGIEDVTRRRTYAEIAAVLKGAGVPHAPITPIEKVADLDFVMAAALRTKTPDGRTVRLPPPAVSTPFLESRGNELAFAPGYGEHTDAVLQEAGLGAREVADLREQGVVA
ncbi:MAG: CoA transferase [Planctomycetes bacterium]|nr:CoA transferase [Planctomycetota bacterium]